MRRRLWQLHSWLGLVAGLGLLLIGLTGSALIFRDQLESWFHRQWVHVTPTDEGRRSFDELLTMAETQLAGYEITGWIPRYDEPTRADLLYVIQHGTNEWLIATLNPYTGEVLASPRLATRTVTGWLLELHYAFLADHAGMLFVGGLGLVLCFLGVSGLWIYREFWKHLFTLRWGRGWRIFCSDLHKAVGISSVALNLLLGFTGAYWNLTHVLGHVLEPEPEQVLLPGRVYPADRSLDRLLTDAAARLPGFRANYLSLPWEPDGGFTLWGAVEPRAALRGPYGSTITYDNAGQFVALDDLRAASSWRQMVDAFTPLHFGTFGGWPVKMLWSFAGLTPGILAISGFLIWRSRRRRPTSSAVAPALSSRRSRQRPEVVADR